MNADRWEFDGQASCYMYATLSGIEQLGRVRMARVEAGVGIYDANNGPGECIFTVP